MHAEETFVNRAIEYKLSNMLRLEFRMLKERKKKDTKVNLGLRHTKVKWEKDTNRRVARAR